MIRVTVTSSSDIAAAVRSLGGRVLADVSGTVTAAEVPAKQIATLASKPGVQSVYPDFRLRPLLDTSVPEIRANAAWGLNDNKGLPVQGRHVLVGIVDSGIDYHNADFKNPDGSTRIKYIWDQTVSGRAPAGFSFGYECDESSINTGQCPERDTDGHGTHVSGIAAGNGRSSNPAREIGVAPQADIIVVKTDLDVNNIIAGWKYIIAKAHQLAEPIAINNSFGSPIGPHDGSEADTRALDALSGPGKIFLAATGNDGNQGIHADGQVGQGASAPLVVTSHGGSTDLAFGMFYSTKDQLSVTLTNVDTGETIGPVAEGSKIDGQTASDGKTKVTIDATPWDAGHNSVLVDVDASGTGHDIAGTWRLTIVGSHIVDSGRYDAWLPQGTGGYQSFASADELDTIGDPADARSVISVGNYITRNQWTDENAKQHSICDFFFCQSSVPQVGDIHPTSSLGPTADGRQKPDISAPGTMIISSLSHDAPICSDAQNGQQDNCLDPAQITPGGANLVEAGTSMASPHVAGVVALMLQADPALDPAAVTAMIRSTARHDQFTGSQAWTPAFGAGKIDAYSSVEAALKASRITATPRPGPTSTSTPSPAPTPARSAFQLVLVRTDRGSTKRSTDPLAPSVKKTRAGLPLLLSIYANYSGLPIGQKATVSWRVMRSSVPVFVKISNHTVKRSQTGIGVDQAVYVPRQAGKYVFQGAVTVSGVRQQRSTAFSVVAAHK